MRIKRVVHLVGVGLSIGPAALCAQDARFEGRLSPALRVEVERLADSARASGLPSEPLVTKALEGAAKGAPDERILQAVRGLATRLGDARRSLGPTSSPGELAVGAEALRSGVTGASLDQLRRARGKDELTVPLAVLTDLVARGVPADTAAAVILQLAQRKADDADFDGLRREIERDIGRGVPPGAAASFRGRGGPPANVPGRGGVPPGQAKKPPKEPPNPPRGRP